jgi:hypothetical protein
MKISDKKSFASFLESIRKEIEGSPENWENTNLKDFLEAMHRYTIDIQGYYDNTNQNIDSNIPSWQVFADIIKGATIYE